MTIDTQKLRALIACARKGWGLDTARYDDDAEVALIGSEQDGEFYPVISIDTGQYEHHDHAMPLARYYASVSPSDAAALLDLIDAQAAEIERLREVLAGVLVPDLVPLLPAEYIAAVQAALARGEA